MFGLKNATRPSTRFGHQGNEKSGTLFNLFLDAYAAVYLTPYKMQEAEAYLLFRLDEAYEELASRDHCLSFDAYVSTGLSVLITNYLLADKQILQIISHNLGLQFSRQDVDLEAATFRKVGNTARLVFATATAAHFSAIDAAINNIALTPGKCIHKPSKNI